MGFFIIKLSHPDGLKNRSGWKKTAMGVLVMRFLNLQKTKIFGEQTAAVCSGPEW